MSNVRRCDRVRDVKSANEVEAIITTVYSIVYRNQVLKVSCRSSKTPGPILRRRLQFPQRFPQNLGVSEMKENRHRGSRKSLKTEVFLGFTPQLARRKAIPADQMIRGPRSSRTGSIKLALTSPRTPWTAIPARRNGNVSSQTIGYSTRASRASGQHRMNRMTHRKKPAMATPFVTTARRSVRRATAERPASTL